ncbi:helix-turn-helix domain-containing protein [Gemmiger formicilis]|uniref:helix-turn-helix domain-containing protein n=1 Tax=Gemmiger formicilis TaxID=745368 RepID=UPI003FD89680
MKKYNYENQKNISGERIRQLRKANKLSQNQLAIKMQTEGVIMEQDVISRIESGQRILVDYELFALAQIFKVSSDWIIGLSDKQ